MNISSYDTFFTRLEEQVKSAPNNRRQIISKAIKETHCPYLLSKLQELQQAYKAKAFIIALLLCQWVAAQTTHSVLDLDSSKPLTGATVVIQNETSSEILITSQKGEVSINHLPPFKIQISHVGYETVREDITNENQVSHYLKPTTSTLEEVVVTGQFEPQSARKSVYQVKSIDSRRIEAQAATNLQEVLSNELNIRFTRDNATGTSGLNLQGLSGQNIKILLDGVPIVGRSGTANEIDLSQINVQNIEHIEIVEGPLSVNYGADALAGVINIITKKESNSLNLNVQIQEETIGKGYSWFDDGLHNASVQVRGSIAEKWSVEGNVRLNNYGGWTGTGTERDKMWYPKDQFFTGGLIRYAGNDFDIYYRLDYLDETITNLGEIQDSNPLRDPYAIDEQYLANRMNHQIQANAHLKDFTLNSVVSFTDYERRTHQFSTNLATGSESTTNDSEQDTIYYSSFFQRQTLTNNQPWTLGSVGINMQLGVDSDIQTAGGSTLSAGDKHSTDLGVFTSVELDWNRLKVRPGVRLIYNSLFESSPTPSVNVKYGFNDQLTLRLGYGRGFRAPSIRELYHEFIDANHNIVGNENLKPEYSHNVNADIDYQLSVDLNFELSGFYNHIDNQITYFTPAASNQPTSYVNLFVYRTTGGTLEGEWTNNVLQINSGVSYIGRYQRLSESEDVPQFVFSPNANLNVIYRLLDHWQLASYYRYTGANKSYQLVEEGDESLPQLRQIEGFHFWDMNLTRTIKNFKITAGVKNLLNVTSVNSNLSSGSAHGGGTGATSIAYGRSWLLRLNYQFSKQ
ncbi:MAG: TonB-dependent receptor [Flammeovirgaceae bacterium]|nr:TonB-dependent receptor [Flammeovirgaceae bacterium]MBE60736.1 TonB-dependent receptor [Flammeovirgaceae bacterium]HCX20488.1 TonB-dependent receptor [Cytophagales bacterium]|tara:strand:- start:8546 stop:10939 length:2394 start_codon:yes stop_codon:yes gene_type:complete